METNKVIKDNECREYMEGWNACNSGKHFLSNPYGCLAYDGELYRLWQKGFDDNQTAWDSASFDLPKQFLPHQIKFAFSITEH